jgi:hypothetical protein
MDNSSRVNQVVRTCIIPVIPRTNFAKARHEAMTL